MFSGNIPATPGCNGLLEADKLHLMDLFYLHFIRHTLPTTGSVHLKRKIERRINWYFKTSSNRQYYAFPASVSLWRRDRKYYNMSLNNAINKIENIDLWKYLILAKMFHNKTYVLQSPVAYLEPSRTSTTKLFMKVVNG